MEQGKMLAVQVQQLLQDSQNIAAYVQSKKDLLAAKEAQLKNGMMGIDGVQGLEQKLKSSLPSWLAPGNVGDLNQVIWPFMFVSENYSPILAQTSLRTQFANSQEASYVCTHFTKAVYTYNASTNETTYIDPNDTSTPSSGIAPGLQFSIRDGISSREFFNSASNLDNYANPLWPTRLPAPQFIIPRGTYEIIFSNNNADVNYIAILTFWGYKIRVENAESMLSTISG